MDPSIAAIVLWCLLKKKKDMKRKCQNLPVEIQKIGPDVLNPYTP